MTKEKSPIIQGKTTKLESLSRLREEIDTLETKISETKRKEKIIAEKRSPFKSIYKWKAPERPFSPKNKQWYIVVAFISIIAIVLSVLTDTLLLVVAIIAVLTVLYALNTIPPMIFHYEITNKGLKIAKKMYSWDQIPSFWLVRQGENIFLHFDVKEENDPQLMLLIGDGDVSIITKELIKYIDYLSPSEVKVDPIMSIVQGRHLNLGEMYDMEEEE